MTSCAAIALPCEAAARRQLRRERDERAVLPPRNHKQLSGAERGERCIDYLVRIHPHPLRHVIPVRAHDIVELGIREAGTKRLHDDFDPAPFNSRYSPSVNALIHAFVAQ